MARLQYWALRENTHWTRHHAAAKSPLAAIKGRWPAQADDLVWLTALTDTPVDRPLAERWATTFEVVGITGGKRESDRLFRILQQQAADEVTRRTFVKTDERDLIASNVLQARNQAEHEMKRLIDDLPKVGVARIMERDWGGSFRSTLTTEVFRKQYDNIAEILATSPDYDPTEVLKRAITNATHEAQIAPDVVLNSHLRLPETVVALMKAAALNLFVEKAKDLLASVEKTRAAKALQAEIDVLHRSAPGVQPAPRSSGE